MGKSIAGNFWGKDWIYDEGKKKKVTRKAAKENMKNENPTTITEKSLGGAVTKKYLPVMDRAGKKVKRIEIKRSNDRTVDKLTNAKAQLKAVKKFRAKSKKKIVKKK